ncbi:copper resistance protein B [uncultured Sphingomonas sp.]|uniref:copper resistance protein B n=1 Tax=uncultured Sphingomonas sp. TaxID=158754 RepID=UPI00260859B1|nr:copper resistance protein B [uncultured Sphingomonas sp.]
MRRLAYPLGLATLLWSGAAMAQTMDHAGHGGMTMPAADTPPAAQACPPEHAAMGHCKPAAPADAHAGHAMPATGGTALPAGNAPPPPAPVANYADRFWGAEAMAASRAVLRREHGGSNFSQVMIDLAEVRIGAGHDGYHWSGEGWFGGDINRFVIKSEGEGAFGGKLDGGEAQALYSRAIGPYFNLQAGVRQDFGGDVPRTHATIGVEGLAPYWFEVDAAAFLSTSGELTARVGGYYDQRVTQRLILQPRVELNLAAQDIRATGIGAGLSEAELGLRLRYEIAREFAPYVGVAWQRRIGRTADFARARGEDTGAAALVLGIRTWF